MSDNVVALGERPRYIRCCVDCHCTSFTVYDDGVAACAACGDEMLDDGPWFEANPVNTARVLDLDAEEVKGKPLHSVTALATSEAALKRFARRAVENPDGVVFMLIARECGSISFWAMDEAFDGTERRNWARERVEKMLEVESNGSGN